VSAHGSISHFNRRDRRHIRERCPAPAVPRKRCMAQRHSGPSKSGRRPPWGKSAITVGHLSVVRSNTTTEELQLSDEQCVFHLGRHEKPVRSGERGSRHFARRRTALRPGQSTEGAVRAKSGKTQLPKFAKNGSFPATEPGKSVAGALWNLHFRGQ